MRGRGEPRFYEWLKQSLRCLAPYFVEGLGLTYGKDRQAWTMTISRKVQ